MPNLIKLNSSALFKNSKITEVLIREAGSDEYKHYCHAIVFEEGADGFILICAIPCLEQIGRSFHVRRFGYPNPAPIRLSEEVSQILVRGQDFGHTHQGVYL
jgi:hypothetical protein